MKKTRVLITALLLMIFIAYSAAAQNAAVYMTGDISPAGLQAVYEKLNRVADGKVAVKISTGEPGGKNFLSPSLIKDFVLSVNGSIVECNTVYGGRRAATASHRQAAKDHGFTFAPVDIMDADGSVTLPVQGGVRLTENFVGSHFDNYDFYVILSHFKGHSMGGFGGAIKNVSIGMASAMGKAWIHSGGRSRTNPWSGAQNEFLQSMAEATKSVADKLGQNILYINVLNNISIDCDCSSNPATPEIHDIGILASLDPVALDQASVDLALAAEGSDSLKKRIESRNGLYTLEHAEDIGLGFRSYTLIRIDGQ